VLLQECLTPNPCPDGIPRTVSRELSGQFGWAGNSFAIEDAPQYPMRSSSAFMRRAVGIASWLSNKAQINPISSVRNRAEKITLPSCLPVTIRIIGNSSFDPGPPFIGSNPIAIIGFSMSATL